MLRYGLCCPAEDAARAAAAGCGFIELSFSAVARMEASAFSAAKGALEQAGIRAEAMNSFIPGDFALVKMKDNTELQAFLKKGFARAKELGTEVVVFGSSKARKLPRHCSKAEGWSLLAPHCRLAAALGEEAGIAVAVEPLRYAECNAVNTLREGLALMELVGHPNLRLLADLYHMGENGEDFADIVLAADVLRHCHISRPGRRTYPLPEDGYDYRPIFQALKKARYTGRLSIEGKPKCGPNDLLPSVTYLRILASEADF